MTLPPLYKYLDVKGAKSTLGSRAFRHAKRSTYQDPEDMTIRSIFPEEVATAVATLSESAVDVILANVNEPPTCSAKIAEAVVALQEILRQDPAQADILREQIKELKIFDVENIRALSEAFVKTTNEFMQSYRLLCVTTDNASERMWEDYAQDHEGVVLRIEPSTERASKLELFRPVEYRTTRPALYDKTNDFLKGCLFDDQGARSRAMLDKIIYTKTLQYKFEKEYRLAIHMGQEGDWCTLSYDPEEVTELYLGLAIIQEDKRDIVAKAKAVNPNVAIFRVSRDINRKLVFTPTGRFG